MKYFSSLFLYILSIACFAQEIPKIDWDELRKTKPWEATELYKEVPQVTPGKVGVAPSDAVVLFEGKDLSSWERAGFKGGVNMDQLDPMIRQMKNHLVGEEASWTIDEGDMVVKPGEGPISTKRSFGDVQLHIEWQAPKASDKSGQGYSNSGVFLMGLYEVQILNSFQNETYANGQASSVYKQHIPLVNASRPPGEWQEYDIIFMAPKFSDGGSVVSRARVTVFHNGVLVQNNVELLGPTVYIGNTYYVPHAEKLPLVLQDHGDPIRFRNIWIREL